MLHKLHDSYCVIKIVSLQRQPKMCVLQGSAKEWTLGCVKRASAATGGQDAGITQPRDHSLPDPCMVHGPECNSEFTQPRANFSAIFVV